MFTYVINKMHMKGMRIVPAREIQNVAMINDIGSPVVTMLERS